MSSWKKLSMELRIAAGNELLFLALLVMPRGASVARLKLAMAIRAYFVENLEEEHEREVHL